MQTEVWGVTMEEYIKKLLEQVRFREAHQGIHDELKTHIEDQIEANISCGMDEDTAEKRAVDDMGDPVEVGISLDRVHRPQIAWGVIIAAVLVGVIGIMIHTYIEKDRLLIDILNEPPFSADDRYYILFTVLGIGAMLFMYLVDYTTVAKYSKVIATVLVAGYLITYHGSYKFLRLVADKNVLNDEAVNYDRLESLVEFLNNCVSFSFALMFLLIPLYAGILYKYRGQSYGGLIKALLWVFVPRIIPFVSSRYYNMRAFIVVGSMLVQLTYAIKKGWIKVRKIPSIISIWLAYVFYLVYFIRTEVGGFTRSGSNEIKTIMDSMKIFGEGKIYTWGGSSSMQTRGCVSSPAGSYVLTYISAAWGLVIGLAVVMIVAALIVFGFVSMAKSKNQLGQIMGCGCMMWIAVNAIANIVVGFGIVPEFYASFFPFISNNNIVISYVFLGVLISVYKYKDAYPQHVDIKGRSNKEKGLQS